LQAVLFVASAAFLSNRCLAAPDDNQEATPEFRPMHGCVLLAEDHEATVMVAVYILESLGFSCDVVNDGNAALDKIRTDREKYIAVLMDVQMPGMDGFEATKIIRAEEKAKGLPRLKVIAMTAHALQGDRERCLEAGMDDYISKPFHPKELGEKLGIV
jgi:CheY-like chemotaxis protein